MASGAHLVREGHEQEHPDRTDRPFLWIAGGGWSEFCRFQSLHSVYHDDIGFGDGPFPPVGKPRAETCFAADSFFSSYWQTGLSRDRGPSANKMRKTNPQRSRFQLAVYQ